MLLLSSEMLPSIGGAHAMGHSDSWHADTVYTAGMTWSVQKMVQDALSRRLLDSTDSLSAQSMLYQLH